MKKRDTITLIILAVIFLFVFAVIILLNNNTDKTALKTEYNEITLVKDEPVFLSVSDAINKICEYATENISLSFIMKNDVEKTEYKNMTFKADEIYVVSKLNLYKYYIKGSFYADIMDQPPKYIKDGYFILNYDIDNSAYNIEQIKKEKYENASNDEYVFEKINFNEYNRFEYKNLTPKSRALMYFYNYLNKMYYETENAYYILNDETKDKYFNTYEEFKKFVSSYKTSSIKEYSIEGNKIGIIDSEYNEFILEISYVLKYNVTINKAEE